MPLNLAIAVRGTVAGHRLGALRRRGGGVSPPSIPPPPPPPRSALRPGFVLADHCEHVPSDAANDFVIGSPASWFTNNNDIRSGAQHQTSRFHQNVAVTAEAYRLRFEWQYNLGYCSQLNKGQGKSPSFKLLIGGAVQWQWQVDLSAGGEYPHDTRCGGAPQAYSPVQLVEVDLLGVTGDKLTWEIVSNDRNMHVNFVHMELCSRGARGRVRAAGEGRGRPEGPAAVPVTRPGGKHQRQQHAAACRSARFWELLVGLLKHAAACRSMPQRAKIFTWRTFFFHNMSNL